MHSFDIITDATSDLSVAEAEELGVRVLPIGLSVAGKSFLHYPDCRELPSSEFYSALRAGLDVSTAATGLAFWLDEMELSLAAGRDIIVLPLAGSLTGGYNNACMAANELRESFPERKIFVIDTVCASLGLGLLVRKAAVWRAEGMGVSETAAHLETAKSHIVHLFTVDSLDHLRRGGRISAASAIIGSVLAVKPILNFDKAGKISVIEKCRGRKNSVRAMASYITEHALPEPSPEVGITHADCEKDALLLADEVKTLLPDAKISINLMAPVLAAHAGPGGLALFFVGTRPK